MSDSNTASKRIVSSSRGMLRSYNHRRRSRPVGKGSIAEARKAASLSHSKSSSAKRFARTSSGAIDRTALARINKEANLTAKQKVHILGYEITILKRRIKDINTEDIPLLAMEIAGLNEDLKAFHTEAREVKKKIKSLGNSAKESARISKARKKSSKRNKKASSESGRTKSKDKIKKDSEKFQTQLDSINSKIQEKEREVSKFKKELRVAQKNVHAKQKLIAKLEKEITATEVFAKVKDPHISRADLNELNKNQRGEFSEKRFAHILHGLKRDPDNGVLDFFGVSKFGVYDCEVKADFMVTYKDFNGQSWIIPIQVKSSKDGVDEHEKVSAIPAMSPNYSLRAVSFATINKLENSPVKIPLNTWKSIKVASKYIKLIKDADEKAFYSNSSNDSDRKIA